MLSSITLNAAPQGAPTSRVDRVATGPQNTPTTTRLEVPVSRAGNSAVSKSGPTTALSARQQLEAVELSLRSRQLATFTERSYASDATPTKSVPIDGSRGNNSGVFALSTEGLPKASVGQRPEERERNVFDSKDDERKHVFASPTDKELNELDEAALRERNQREQEVRVREQEQTQALAAEVGEGKDPVRLVVERGPDGKEYVTNGSVSIDVSVVKDDPQATIIKMWRAQAAALASGSATGVDQQVGALTNARLTEALQELAKERFAAMQGSGNADSPTTSGLILTA